MMRTSIIILLLIGFNNLMFAQKTDAVLKTINSSEFFIEFAKLKNKAEESVIKLKTGNLDIDKTKLELLKNSYENSAERFNSITRNIAFDMLDKRKRKVIIDYPEIYARNLEAQLVSAEKYYTSNYVQHLLDVTNGQILGNPILEMLPQLIALTRDIVELISDIRNEAKKMNELHIESGLINPLKFRSWEELYN